MMKRSNDTTGRAGEHYVAAELSRRGAYASPFSGNVPGIDVIATDRNREQLAYIQVKTKRRGVHWQMSLKHGWDIPNPAPSCLCLGECVPNSACEDNHSHHRYRTLDLLQAREIPGKPDHYWAFVSLDPLAFWIIPDDIVRGSLIREGHKRYLKSKGGHRPGKAHGSLFAIVREDGIAEWKGRWDVLGLNLIEG